MDRTEFSTVAHTPSNLLARSQYHEPTRSDRSPEQERHSSMNVFKALHYVII